MAAFPSIDNEIFRNEVLYMECIMLSVFS